MAVVVSTKNVAPEGGPLAGSGGFAYPWVLDVDGTMTDAISVLTTPPGTPPITITSVVPEYADSALVLAGVWVASADRDISDGGVAQAQYDDAPPRDPRLGTLLAPGEATVRNIDDEPAGTQVLVATTVTAPGRHLLEGYWVTYKVEGRDFRDFIQVEITFCTSDYLDDAGECEMRGELAKQS